MRMHIKTWQERIDSDKGPYDHSEKYRAEEVADLRAALAQKEAAAPIGFISAGSIKHALALGFGVSAYIQAGQATDEFPIAIYTAPVEASAPGDLHAAIMALALSEFAEETDQPKTFGCHHSAKTCRGCESMVIRWEKEQPRYSENQIRVLLKTAAELAHAALAQPVAVDAPNKETS